MRDTAVIRRASKTDHEGTTYSEHRTARSRPTFPGPSLSSFLIGGAKDGSVIVRTRWGSAIASISRIRLVAPSGSALSPQSRRDFGLGRLYVVQQDFEICLSVRSEGTKD